MARSSRISENYRRRLRLSSRDVLVAAVVTVLAGAAVAAALWGPAAPGAHSTDSVEAKR